MKISIPGRFDLNIKNLLLDYNGTIALDGKLIKGVEKRLKLIKESGINIFVLTADTHGTVAEECESLPLQIKVFNNGEARFAKRKIAEELDGKLCAAIGNGFNDALMFEEIALSIVILGNEGCSPVALRNADIVCKSIEDALDLFLNESRIIATLRG